MVVVTIVTAGCGDPERLLATPTVALVPTSTTTPTRTATSTPSVVPTTTSTISPTPIPTSTNTPAGCHTMAECTNMLCLEPGGNPGSGEPTRTPSAPECVNDSDCTRFGETVICSTQKCVPGCTVETMCAVGQICAASHHCVPRPCVLDADCPQFFACYGATSSTSGGCSRRVCDMDTDCLGGFCVNRLCYDKLGTCVPFPA